MWQQQDATQVPWTGHSPAAPTISRFPPSSPAASTVLNLVCPGFRSQGPTVSPAQTETHPPAPADATWQRPSPGDARLRGRSVPAKGVHELPVLASDSKSRRILSQGREGGDAALQKRGTSKAEVRPQNSRACERLRPSPASTGSGWGFHYPGTMKGPGLCLGV